ncbi:TlpA family protein disulfide reductase [Singulisphaera rosea]
MRMFVLVTLIALPLSPEDAQSPTPKERYAALLEEYEAAGEAWGNRFDAAPGEESKVDWVARSREWPGWSFAPRFLAIAEENPQDPVAIDALVWVTGLAQNVGANDRRFYPQYRRALELLSQGDRLDHELVRKACQGGLQYASPASESFLRLILERAHNRASRGAACFSLARVLTAKGLIARSPWFDRVAKTPFDTYQNQSIDPDFAKYIHEADPKGSDVEAEGLFERAMTEFGDLGWRRAPGKDGRELTIADVAKSELNELRNLAVGKVAPEIEGEDLDGKPMRLSDYRGKVVVLTFWATWCGPCMSLVPHERALVERLAGRRFVLLGIDGDEDREKAKSVVTQERITWRSWWNGGPSGPITERWNVDGWPTVYVLDARGVIRHKQAIKERLDDAVDGLLKELESAKS